jgi:hypothetical protein
MKDRATVSKAFNKHFFEFLEDIQRIFPENGDIKYALTSFETIKKLNATAIIKAWYTHVYIPYNEVIESGDIDFFINKDYSEELSDVSKGGDIIKMIDKIRSPIANMEQANKDHCAKYIQNLSKLSMVYQSLK